MVPIPRLLAVLLGIALVVTGPAVFAQTPAAITVKDFSFQPSELSIPAGTTVQWTNQDGAPHQVESDDGTVAGTVMSTGQTFSFTFATPGRVTYHCAIHSSMTGAVVVR